MPGVLPLSAFQVGKETTKGTAVATTRELYPDMSGMFDPGFVASFHEGAQRGTFGNITHATLLHNNPTVNYRTEPSHGVTFDELIIPCSQLLGAQSGSGGGADKTWTFTTGQTSRTYDTFTLNAYDGQQGYEVEYGLMTGWELSAGFDDLTQLSCDWVGRQSTKVTIDVVAANNAVKIPSALWTLKYATAQSGLDGASALANTMRAFRLRVDPGIVPRRYADGNKYFGQGVAAGNVGGTLQMTWDATSDAVTQYDNWAAQTVGFFRLKATGPALGASNYSAQFDVAVLWEDIRPLGSTSEGVAEYVLTGRIVYDATWANNIVPTIVCSLATMP